MPHSLELLAALLAIATLPPTASASSVEVGVSAVGVLSPTSWRMLTNTSTVTITAACFPLPCARVSSRSDGSASSLSFAFREAAPAPSYASNIRTLPREGAFAYGAFAPGLAGGGLSNSILVNVADITFLLTLAQALEEQGGATIALLDEHTCTCTPMPTTAAEFEMVYALEQSLARTILALHVVVTELDTLAFDPLCPYAATGAQFASRGFNTTLGTGSQTVSWYSPLQVPGTPTYALYDLLHLGHKTRKLNAILNAKHTTTIDALSLSHLISSILSQITALLPTCPLTATQESFGCSASAPFGAFAASLAPTAASSCVSTNVDLGAPAAAPPSLTTYASCGDTNPYATLAAPPPLVAAFPTYAGASCDFALQTLLAQLASAEVQLGNALRTLTRLDERLESTAFPSGLRDEYWGTLPTTPTLANTGGGGTSCGQGFGVCTAAAAPCCSAAGVCGITTCGVGCQPAFGACAP